MVTRISRDKVQRLLRWGAQVVEVLPKAEYEWRHIAGAINLPLTELNGPLADGVLDRGRPVIVYCHDFQ